MTRNKVVIAGCLAFATLSLHAQFFDRLANPTVELTLTHPPGLGINVNRVVFLGNRGKCTDEFKNALIEDFVAAGVQVAEREVIASILDEYDFASSGYMDKNSVISLGKVIGPTTLIYLEGHRCNTEKNQFYKEFKRNDGTPYKVFYARTDGFFKGVIRVIDLETASIFTAKTIEGLASQQLESQEGFPVYPSDYDVLTQALQDARQRVSRLFFPWREAKHLVFFDNKKGNLKAAYQAFKIGDIDGALAISEQNLRQYQQASDRKDKIWSYAHYNMGMCHLVRFEYDQALAYFREAYRIKPGGIIEQAITECQRAQSLAEEMRQVEERAEMMSDEAAPATTPDRVGRGQDAAVASEPAAAQPADDIEARLAKLKNLFEKGLLTKEEYEAKKKEILASL